MVMRKLIGAGTPREAVAGWAGKTALAAGLDQFIAAEPGQVLGHGRLAEADEAFQLTDAFFAHHELAKDKQPVLVAHGFQKAAGVPCVGV